VATVEESAHRDRCSSSCIRREVTSYATGNVGGVGAYPGDGLYVRHRVYPSTVTHEMQRGSLSPSVPFVHGLIATELTMHCIGSDEEMSECGIDESAVGDVWEVSDIARGRGSLTQTDGQAVGPFPR
jgi:hypothetical protein